jgi:hypothetical protein
MDSAFGDLYARVQVRLLRATGRARWKESPDNPSKFVLAFCALPGMEQDAEWGNVRCSRMWDYRHGVRAAARGDRVRRSGEPGPPFVRCIVQHRTAQITPTSRGLSFTTQTIARSDNASAGALRSSPGTSPRTASRACAPKAPWYLKLGWT